MLCTSRYIALLSLTLALFSVACGDDDPDIDTSPGVTPKQDMARADSGADPVDMGMDTPDSSSPPDMPSTRDQGVDPVDMSPEPEDMTPDLPPITPGEKGELGWAIGRSQVGKRPMFAELYGDEGPVLFVLAAIHGNERIAISYGERMRTLLLGGLAERLGMRVFLMQAGNPDGIDANDRYNGRGIDLNRNFPADNFDPNAGGGSRPLSESESTLLALTMDWTEPSAVISAHCCIGLIDYDGPGDELALRMEGVIEPIIGFPAERVGSRPGSLGSYVGYTLALPIITLEFGRANEYEATSQLLAGEAGTEEAALWVSLLGGAAEVDVVERVEPLTDSTYTQRALGQSASGVTIRQDVMGAAKDGALLLSGLDGRGRLGEHVAEHVRRQVLTELNEPMQHIEIVTLLNPDGLQSKNSENVDGDDVLADLASAMPTTSEAQGLEATLENPDIKTIYIIEDAANDAYSVHGPDKALVEALLDRGAISITRQESAPSAYAPLVEALVARGKTVVFMGVSSERLEAQGSHSYKSPSPYWQIVATTL